jgi:hypothetical protein
MAAPAQRAQVFGQPAPTQGLILPSAARTATPATVEFGPPDNAVGIQVRVVTTASAAPSTVVNIEAYDYAQETWFTVLASAAIVGNGTIALTVDPRLAAAANLTAQSGLYEKMRVNAVHGNGNSHTYSVTVHAWA